MLVCDGCNAKGDRIKEVRVLSEIGECRYEHGTTHLCEVCTRQLQDVVMRAVPRPRA